MLHTHSVAGTLQTVQWNVANTTAAPVSCPDVGIYFSDSGFPVFTDITLIASTPNDGSADITVPEISTSTGRLMVKCVSSPFFDMNDADISISTGADCGNTILDAGEQCDDGNSEDGDGCSAACQVEDNWSCTLPVPPVPGSNALPEGGFEGGTPNPAWAETSTNFGTPLCNDTCGIPDGANTGEWYAWFGGVAALETASLQQDFLIQSTDEELTFARQINACDSADDFVRLMFDGVTVWEADGASPDCGESAYSTETIDLGSAPGGPWNDDAVHAIRFESSIFVTNGGWSNFFVDDVSILRGGTPPQPSVCTFQGGSSFTIGGTVSGLAGSGLVLQNNAGDDLAISADGSFTFATPLTDGSDYEVTVLTQPVSLSQTCTVSNGAGTLDGADISNVEVSCVTNSYTVGGTVSGLLGSGLVLQNNNADDLAIGADGDFTFPTPLADGSAYAVTVLTQPGGPEQSCGIAAGNGTISGADISDVEVSCSNVDPEIIHIDGFEGGDPEPPMN